MENTHDRLEKLYPEHVQVDKPAPGAMTGICDVYDITATRIESVDLVQLWPVTRLTMAHDSEVLAHRNWLGFIQPVGLVVSVFSPIRD